MEITSVKSFLEYYSRIKRRTELLINIVPPEHLDFSYKEGKFSIGDQIRHIATMERYMFAETIAGRNSSYRGCGKELAEDYTSVVTYYRELYRESVEIISSLKDEDLNLKCTTPGNVQIAIWKWLRAMVEHEIHHRGQIYIYLNMLDVITPPMFGLTAEEVQERSK